MFLIDERQTRKKRKRKTKATAKKMTMKTRKMMTATRSERAPYLFQRVTDEARTFRQSGRGGIRLAPARISQPYKERRDSRRGFPAEPVTAPAGAATAIAARHLSRRASHQEELL